MPLGGGRQQPAPIRGAGIAPGVLSAGEEGTAFFRAAFTMRLPVVIQAHLAGMEITDLKELAQLADRLWQCHGPQTVAAVAVEEDQSDDGSKVVAALLARRRPQKKQGGPHGHNKGQQGRQVAGNKSSKASGGKFLCHTHAKYGEDTFHCGDRRNCTWSGN